MTTTTQIENAMFTNTNGKETLTVQMKSLPLSLLIEGCVKAIDVFGIERVENAIANSCAHADLVLAGVNLYKARELNNETKIKYYTRYMMQGLERIAHQNTCN